MLAGRGHDGVGEDVHADRADQVLGYAAPLDKESLGQRGGRVFFFLYLLFLGCCLSLSSGATSWRHFVVIIFLIFNKLLNFETRLNFGLC